MHTGVGGLLTVIFAGDLRYPASLHLVPLGMTLLSYQRLVLSLGSNPVFLWRVLFHLFSALPLFIQPGASGVWW